MSYRNFWTEMINRANSHVIYVVVLISLPMLVIRFLLGCYIHKILQKDCVVRLVFCGPWGAGHYGFFLMFLFSSPYLLAFPPSSVYFLSQSPNICHPPLSLAVTYLLFYPFIRTTPLSLHLLCFFSSFPPLRIIRWDTHTSSSSLASLFLCVLFCPLDFRRCLWFFATSLG